MNNGITQIGSPVEAKQETWEGSSVNKGGGAEADTHHMRQFKSLECSRSYDREWRKEGTQGSRDRSF